MKKRSLFKIASLMYLLVCVLFIWQTPAFAATVGNSLNIPESGWQRIDNVNGNIKYEGAATHTGSDHWNGSAAVTDAGYLRITFRFYGTKLRIIGGMTKISGENSIIKIDNNEYTFSESGTTVAKALIYEEAELDLGVHTVEIKSPPTRVFVFDAIDIDDAGYLVPNSQVCHLEANSGDATINLKWTLVAEATKFNVKRSITAGGPYETIATDVTGNTYTDTGVTNGTTYYYIVTAIIDGREGGKSNEASATPEASQTTPTTEAKLKVVLEVTEALRLSVDDDLSVNTQMAWSSSNESVATVNEKGIVTALAPGNTVITVKSSDGSYTDHINVLVVENADDYRLAIDLKVGETSRLTVDDFTNTLNVKWAPTDSSIANVTSKGKVTALSKGLVLITAKDEDGNIIGSVYVRVRE